TIRLLFIIATYIQILTFLVSLFTWYKYKHTRLKYLPIYLGINAFLEFFCFNFYRLDNVWLYNIKNFIEFNILCYMFYGYLGKLSKKISIGLICLFNFMYFYNLIFEFDDFRNSLMTYTYVSGSIFLIIIIIMMLNEMLKVESFENITRNLLFWVSFGLFVFYATSF